MDKTQEQFLKISELAPELYDALVGLLDVLEGCPEDEEVAKACGVAMRLVEEVEDSDQGALML